MHTWTDPSFFDFRAARPHPTHQFKNALIGFPTVVLHSSAGFNSACLARLIHFLLYLSIVSVQAAVSWVFPVPHPGEINIR